MSLMQRHELWCNTATKNSHASISTKKGFNFGVWLGLVWFVVNEKRDKQESLNHSRIITNVADQKALQEQLLNNHKVGFLERQCNSAMNYSAQSNVEHEQP